MSEQLDKNTNQTDERLTKESLQLQKALWIREEVNKKRAQEDQLLDQIFREQQLLQEMDDDMDANMEHVREGRKYREDIRERVEDRVYEIHDLSADKREGMREYKQAYRRGYALAMFFLSLALCVFAGYLHGITSQICLVLLKKNVLHSGEFFAHFWEALFFRECWCFLSDMNCILITINLHFLIAWRERLWCWQSRQQHIFCMIHTVWQGVGSAMQKA